MRPSWDEKKPEALMGFGLNPPMEEVEETTGGLGAGKVLQLVNQHHGTEFTLGFGALQYP
jgi:hypothetical protein